MWTRKSFATAIGTTLSSATWIVEFVAEERKTESLAAYYGQLTDEQKTLAADEELLGIWEQPPSVPAFVDLMNRAIDRPPEAIKLSHDLSGTVEFVISKPWSARAAPLGTVGPQLALPTSSSQATKTRRREDNGDGHG